MKYLWLLLFLFSQSVLANQERLDEALFSAIFDGTLQEVKDAIDAGADIHAKDRDGDTPLHISAGWRSNPHITRLIMSEGGDVNAKNHKDLTPVHYAAFKNDNPDVLEALLLHEDLDPNARNEIGNTSLHLVIGEDRTNPYILILLIKYRVPVDAKNENDLTALHYSFTNSNPDMMKTLLEHGADPGIKDMLGNNAFHLAAIFCENPHVIRTLAEFKKDNLMDNINAENESGITPWQLATLNSNPDIAQVLLELGAQPIEDDSESFSFPSFLRGLIKELGERI